MERRAFLDLSAYQSSPKWKYSPLKILTSPFISERHARGALTQATPTPSPTKFKKTGGGIYIPGFGFVSGSGDPPLGIPLYLFDAKYPPNFSRGIIDDFDQQGKDAESASPTTELQRKDHSVPIVPSAPELPQWASFSLEKVTESIPKKVPVKEKKKLDVATEAGSGWERVLAEMAERRGGPLKKASVPPKSHRQVNRLRGFGSSSSSGGRSGGFRDVIDELSQRLASLRNCNDNENGAGGAGASMPDPATADSSTRGKRVGDDATNINISGSPVQSSSTVQDEPTTSESELVLNIAPSVEYITRVSGSMRWGKQQEDAARPPCRSPPLPPPLPLKWPPEPYIGSGQVSDSIDAAAASVAGVSVIQRATDDTIENVTGVKNHHYRSTLPAGYFLPCNDAAAAPKELRPGGYMHAGLTDKPLDEMKSYIPSSFLMRVLRRQHRDSPAIEIMRVDEKAITITTMRADLGMAQSVNIAAARVTCDMTENVFAGQQDDVSTATDEPRREQQPEEEVPKRKTEVALFAETLHTRGSSIGPADYHTSTSAMSMYTRKLTVADLPMPPAFHNTVKKLRRDAAIRERQAQCRRQVALRSFLRENSAINALPALPREQLRVSSDKSFVVTEPVEVKFRVDGRISRRQNRLSAVPKTETKIDTVNGEERHYSFSREPCPHPILNKAHPNPTASSSASGSQGPNESSGVRAAHKRRLEEQRRAAEQVEMAWRKALHAKARDAAALAVTAEHDVYTINMPEESRYQSEFSSHSWSPVSSSSAVPHAILSQWRDGGVDRLLDSYADSDDEAYSAFC